jgi:adenine-specific DNA-methyltransferase
MAPDAYREGGMRMDKGAAEVPVDNIHNGDCLEWLGGLRDSCVDLVVSSPPYNLGKEYESRMALERYVEEQTAVLRECARVLSDKGSIFWQVGSYSDSGTLIPLDIRIFPILENLGLIPRNRMGAAPL